MTRDEFWKIIEDCRPSGSSSSESAHSTAIRDKLASMDVTEIRSFGNHFQELMNEANIADLAAAMDVIEGGIGDDGFFEYRAGLILRGRSVFDVVVRDPERAVDYLEEDGNSLYEPEMLTVAVDAYEQKTGNSDLPNDWLIGTNAVKGQILDDAGIRKRFPKLCERYWDRS